jgi:sulfhydrogenase subunit gamma (sulfur reductase)
MDGLFLPRLARIAQIRDETPDTRTFRLRLQEPGDGFVYRPGQFLELSVFGFGEAPFCLASSPTRGDGIETTARRVGRLTNALHALRCGDELGVRGPFGNGFDVSAAYGKDLLFVAGGLGLPPLRSLIWNVLDERARFGRVTILYGARTPDDVVYKDELRAWAAREDVEVRVTVDSATAGWPGNVGIVPTLFGKVELHPDETVAFMCGPPLMIRVAMDDLLRRGFSEDAIVSTLERMMQCGVGKCNHCAIGHRYVCLDGPVFSCRQIRELVE